MFGELTANGRAISPTAKRSQGGESLSQRQESLKAGTISYWSQYFASAINLSQRSQDIVNVNKRTSTTVDVCIQN